MSLPIACLPAAELDAAPEARSTGGQARSQGQSKAWEDALARATASPTVTPAARPRAAVASGDKDAASADAGQPATTPPSGVAAAKLNASNDASTARTKGFDDPSGASAEPTLPIPPRATADAAATAAATEQDQEAASAATPNTKTVPQTRPARQATAQTRTAMPDRHPTAPDGTVTETASAAARPPEQASSASRTEPSSTVHQEKRRNHPQQAVSLAPVAPADPSAGLGAGATLVAMAAPIRPDPTPPIVAQFRSDGTLKVAGEARPGHLARALPWTTDGSAPQPSIQLAEIPTPAASASIQGGPGRQSASTAPGIAQGRPTVSISPPAQAAVPVAHAPSNRAPPGMTEPGLGQTDKTQAAAALQASAAAPAAIVTETRGVQTAPLLPAGDPAPAPAEVTTPLTPSPVSTETGALPAMPPPIAIGTSGDPQNPPAGSASVPQNPAAIPAQISGRQPSTSGTLAGTPAIAIRTEGTTASAASAGSPNSGGPLLRPTSGAAASTDGAALADRAQAARATLATTTPGRVGPTANLAIPQPAGPGDRNSPTIGHGLFGSGSAPAPAAVTGGSPFPLAAPTPGAGGSPQLQGLASMAGLSQPPLGGQPPAIPATATALAASVVAMSQSGQSTTVLRLDPPSLGALSIHIALTGNATVNVVFVPSVPQTAQLIHGALPDLHHAMASAGLNLGEAQVGGGAGGSPNGQAGHQTGERTSFAQTAILSRTASEAEPAPVKDGLRGARAVA